MVCQILPFVMILILSTSIRMCNKASKSDIIIIKEQGEMLKQPVNQIKMTNVAEIQYKINKKHFQIACYRNKAVNWRNGLEEDIGEVLQIEEIFENASHGVMAKKSDLNKYFPNKSKREIIQIILQRGELQVTDKEREVQLNNLMADVVKIIVEKCVHSVTQRRFTPDTIRMAIRDIRFPLKLDQPAKKQALDCIKMLQQKYKISRGLMQIRITADKEQAEQLIEKMVNLGVGEPNAREQKGIQVSLIYNIEPNKYRDIDQSCKKMNKVTLEVLVQVIANENAKDLEAGQFSALELLDHLAEEEKVEGESEVKIEKKKQEKGKKEEKGLKCTTCGQHAVFATAQDQRLHFKSDWHVENIKRKSKNLPALSEQEYKIEKFNEGFK